MKSEWWHQILVLNLTLNMQTIFLIAILSIRQAVIILSSSWKPSTCYIKWIENIIITCSCNTEERKNKPNLNLSVNEFKLQCLSLFKSKFKKCNNILYLAHVLVHLKNPWCFGHAYISISIQMTYLPENKDLLC